MKDDFLSKLIEVFKEFGFVVDEQFTSTFTERVRMILKTRTETRINMKPAVTTGQWKFEADESRVVLHGLPTKVRMSIVSAKLAHKQLGEAIEKAVAWAESKEN